MKIEMFDEYLEKLNKVFQRGGYDPIESQEAWESWILDVIDMTVESWFGEDSGITGESTTLPTL